MVALSTFIPHILFPLYIYPSPGAWQPLYSEIAAYPNVTFNVIINPASGPGTTTYPDSNYIAGITTLNSYPNTNLLGYVHTSYATRTLASVEADVFQYSNWSSYTPSNIKLSGIFFDEIPSAYDSATYTYLQSITSYATSLSLPTTILNPGTPPATQYYPLSTYTLVYEDYYVNFSPTSLSTVPASYVGKALVVLHDFTGTGASQTSLVTQLKSTGVGGIFISTVEYYSFSALWTSFVTAVASL